MGACPAGKPAEGQFALRNRYAWDLTREDHDYVLIIKSHQLGVEDGVSASLWR